jgi:hypothetical protein
MADTKKYLHNLDVINNKVMNLLLNPLTTAQRTTIGGTLGLSDQSYVCYDTDLDQQYFWDGTQWITVGGGITGSGTLNYIAKWTPSGTALGDSSIQDSSIGIVATNSITAASAVAKSVNLTSTLIAAANGDLLSALDINTTFTDGAFTGLTKRLFRATADTVLRTELRDSGIQQWYLNDGTAEVGQVGYGTPNGHPGIVMFNASLTGRSDIRHMTSGGFTIATHALGTIPLVDQFYFNPSGNLGIGTTNDTYRLEVVNTATPAANYARFANDTSNKNAIILSTSTSAAITLTGPLAERKLLIGNGGTNRADFITYQDNYFNFSYSNVLGGAQLPASLVKFTPSFTYSTGTNSHTILDIYPNISITGGTNTLRGIYYNPNNTAGTVTTEIAFENTQGDIIHGNLSGGSTRMVVADSTGKLGTQTIPSTGSTRSVNVVSTATAAGSTAGTDYVYLVSGTTTVTLPTAVGNTNRYTIKRSGTGVVSIATTSSQTIDGSSSPITINVQSVSIDLISNGTDWEII